MLGQRIMAIALGYEDVNDHETLRCDPALQVAADCSPESEDPMASPSTLCRLENRITRKAIVELHRVMVDQFLDSDVNWLAELRRVAVKMPPSDKMIVARHSSGYIECTETR